MLRAEAVDDHFPGLIDRTDCRPTVPDESYRSPSDWVPDRNPGYPDAPSRMRNCGDCTRASEATWRGLDTQAGVLADPEARGEAVVVMETWSSGELTPTNFDGIRARLESLGPGSSALVAGWWKDGDGGGHWFNAINDNGVVHAVDGQRGRSEPWPPTPEVTRLHEGRFEHVEAIFIDSFGRHLPHDEQR